MKVCWNLTNLCNENCFYCFRELHESARSIDDNLVIIDALKDLSITSITYAGGEPLIYPELEKLLIYASSLGIKNNIITNGRNLTLDNLDLYLPHIEKLTFSVDSPNDYVNGRIGRGLDHYRHIRAILPEIKKRYPSVIIEINSVANKEHLGELEFMFESLCSEIAIYGLKKWKISRFCPLRGYALERKDRFILSDEEFSEIEKMHSDIPSPFSISVRNTDSIEENLIISPNGKLKKTTNGEEEVLIDDLVQFSKEKALKIGGFYV